MPATHSAKVRQMERTRDAVLNVQQSNQTSHNHTESLFNDLDLTVSFLGCPSNSTTISLPTPCLVSNEQSDGENNKTDRSSRTLVNDDCLSGKVSSKSEIIWNQNQGQNNNRCSEPSEENDEDHGNESSDQREDGREISRFRASLRNRAEEQTARTSFLSTSGNESVRQNEELARSEESSGPSDQESVDEAKRDIGFQNSRSITSPYKRNTESKPRGWFRASKSNKYSTQEQCPTGQRTRKSTQPAAGCGRASMSRIQRSPQRNYSPSRRKKGDNLHGSSAPVPFMPTPAQSSIGRTDISRPSSVSPTRREQSSKSSAKKTTSVLGSFIKATTFRSRDGHGSVDGLSDMRRSILKPPSPSLAASNLLRSAESVGPTQSQAEADLRDRKRGSNQSKPPASAVDIHPIQCQLILPDEPWSNGAPHGDIQQTHPLRMLEMTRMAIHEQQQAYHQNRKASIVLQESEIGTSGCVKLPTSEMTVTLSDQKNTTTRNAKSTAGLDDNKASLSPSYGTATEPKSGRQRSSRRHPVLDKMFRHVLASLMMESGPPSSACLASVLDQVEGMGTSDSLRSQSRTSSVSSTNTFTSRLLNSRFGRARVSTGADIHSVESGSADLTLSLSSQLPCELQKINEEVKTNCATCQGEAKVAVTDV